MGNSKANHSGAQGTFKGALQLLSKRHKQIHFAYVHERPLLSRSVELLTAITGD